MVAPINFEVDERYYFEIAGILAAIWLASEGLYLLGSLLGLVLIVIGYILAFSGSGMTDAKNLELLSWLKWILFLGLIFFVLWIFNINIKSTSGIEIPSLGLALYSVVHIPAYFIVYMYFKLKRPE